MSACFLGLALGAGLLILITISDGVRNMAGELGEVLDAVGRIEANVENVAAVKAELATAKDLIAALEAQIAAGTGATPEQLAAIRDRLNAADAATDALTNPPAPETPTE